MLFPHRPILFKGIHNLFLRRRCQQRHHHQHDAVEQESRQQFIKIKRTAQRPHQELPDKHQNATGNHAAKRAPIYWPASRTAQRALPDRRPRRNRPAKETILKTELSGSRAKIIAIAAMTSSVERRSAWTAFSVIFTLNTPHTDLWKHWRTPPAAGNPPWTW